ncbi:protein piccolo [Trichonephila clavipes]|nr:protein piccolo [Trichonephila clavipes]
MPILLDCNLNAHDQLFCHNYVRLTRPWQISCLLSAIAKHSCQPRHRELRHTLRRHTDTGLVFMGLDPYGRGGQRTLQRKARSWHPSPHASEDEEEREERKAKVKAEIARRRQHIEENSRLHDELYKVARFRDPTGGGYISPAYGDRLYTSPISLESGGSSQDSTRDPDLDQDYFLRNQRYPYSSSFPAYGSHRRSTALHSSYPWSYEYPEDDLLYDGVYDYSPLATTDSETDLAPMPLLPDMPTRSRKLLHDLGSTPLYDKQHYRGGVAYDDYVEDRRPPPPPHPSTGDHQHHSTHLRKAQNSKTSQKYDFPVKRILLTRDPKDRSVSGNGLGMKVVGGKEIPGSNGMIGAYVARIYPGGVVETLGEVREGDQVLEWNGVPLTGKTYEEVQRIIASSGDEVEIVIRSDFNMLTSRSSSHHHHHHQQQPQNRRRGEGERHGGHHHQSGGYRSSRSDADGYNRNYDNEDYYQPPADEGVNRSNYADHRGGSSSPSRGYHQGTSRRQQRIVSPVGEKGDSSDNKEKYRAEDISGEIQLQVCHDSKAGILYVTIVRARNLVTSRDNSGLPDPYVICYLLPDRCFENQRRTRYFSRCSNPEWKQTMVYPHVPQDQLKRKHLEISVWNYDINRPPEFLGEVIIDLKDSSVIDEQSRWYKLHPHDPKKYPCQSSSTLNNEGAMKMARLNNPSTQKNTLYFEGADDIRKLKMIFFFHIISLDFNTLGPAFLQHQYSFSGKRVWKVVKIFTHSPLYFFIGREALPRNKFLQVWEQMKVRGAELGEYEKG